MADSETINDISNIRSNFLDRTNAVMPGETSIATTIMTPTACIAATIVNESIVSRL